MTAKSQGRYGDLDPRHNGDPETLQRMIEGQHLDTRLFLHGYEVPLEGQRNKIHWWRQEILESDKPEREKRIMLRTIDDVWADHLARTCAYRSGVHWVSWTGRDALRALEFARLVESDGSDIADRGAVWTYLTTDQTFGRWKREFSRRLPFAIAAYLGMGACADSIM